MHILDICVACGHVCALYVLCVFALYYVILYVYMYVCMYAVCVCVCVCSQRAYVARVTTVLYTHICVCVCMYIHIYIQAPFDGYISCIHMMKLYTYERNTYERSMSCMHKHDFMVIYSVYIHIHAYNVACYVCRHHLMFIYICLYAYTFI